MATDLRNEIKLTVIGGGSKNWARILMKDLALCPHLGGQVRLFDIDYPRALANVQYAEALCAHADAQTRFVPEAFDNIDNALRGADFVAISILPGPMSMFASDLEIPLRYGILQTVGDSTGPGGLMRSLRAIPLFVEFAHAIMRNCPQAWCLNYTNPMTNCVAALYHAAPGIKQSEVAPDCPGDPAITSGTDVLD